MKYLKIILLTVLITGCSQKDNNKFQQIEELNGMSLTNHISGEAAQSMIDKLHGKSVTPAENNIAFYKGDKGEAILYVSFYKNAEDARTTYDKMVKMIRDGNEVFGHFHEIEIDSQKLSMCLGMDQAHYFFNKKNKLFWLSTNYQIAQSTVIDLLNKIKYE